MAYEDFKDLTRRTASDKILHYKAFSIDKTPNMMDINVDLLQWSINVLIKKLLVVVLKMRICQTSLVYILVYMTFHTKLQMVQSQCVLGTTK